LVKVLEAHKKVFASSAAFLNWTGL
jgi:hypothetical protein